MFTPSKMFLFRAVLQERQAELVLFPLLDQTDIQFVEFESVQPENVDVKKFVVSNEYNDIKSIEDKLLAVDHMLHFGDHRPELTNYDFLRVQDHHEDIQRLTEITDKYFGILNKLNSRKNRLEELGEAGAKMKTLDQVDNVFSLDASSVLFYGFGYLPVEQLAPLQKSLQRVPVIVNPLSVVKERSLTLLVGMNKNKSYIESALHSHNWEDVDLSREFHDFRDVYKDLEGARETCRLEIVDLTRQLESLVDQNRDYIYEKYWQFHYLRMLNDIKGYFKRSSGNVYVAFWAPDAEKQKVVDTIRKVTRDHCYIEGIEASKAQSFLSGKIKIPVLFKNPVFFKPFQSFVGAYGVPAYGTIDPTPIFTIIYMLMFGMMFSDAGHGFVILCLGLYFLLNKKANTGIRKALNLMTNDFQKILIYCGASSMVFGVLFGSVFGYEHIIKAVWMHPINNIMLMVGMTIGFGVLYIILGLIFNLINCWILKDLKRGVFDNYGLLGAFFYFGALALLAFSALGKVVPSWVVLLLLGLPIALLFLKGPILYLMKKEHTPFEGGPGTYFPEAVVSTLELFIGYLSNTVSFVRIGAFAISHAGLFIGVFTIETMVRGIPYVGGVGDVILIILGNIVIIGLEGFLSGVQALRLQFYEFFTKFYREGEVVFKPVKLK